MHAGEVLRPAPDPLLASAGDDAPLRRRRGSVSSLAGAELPERSTSPMARRGTDPDASAAGDAPAASRASSPLAAARLRRASDAALFAVRIAAAAAAAAGDPPPPPPVDGPAARRVLRDPSPLPAGDRRQGEEELGACVLCGAPTGGREILCAHHAAEACRPPPAARPSAATRSFRSLARSLAP